MRSVPLSSIFFSGPNYHVPCFPNSKLVSSPVLPAPTHYPLTSGPATIFSFLVTYRSSSRRLASASCLSFSRRSLSNLSSCSRFLRSRLISSRFLSISAFCSSLSASYSSSSISSSRRFSASSSCFSLNSMRKKPQ